jgi:outer membrane protein OmpA-like peptidoglycan-associated protein
VINGNFQLGLTSWETFNFSIFQREGLQPELFFGNLTKLVGNMILGLSYSPEKIFGSSLNFNTRSGENISVAYTKFLGTSSFNSNNATDRVDFQGSLSRIFGSNISSNLYGSYYQGKDYKNLSFTPSFSTYLFNFSIMSKYLLYYTINQNGQISRRDGMDFDISYYTGLGELFGFDNRIRFNFRTNYDFANKQFGNLTLIIDDDLGKGLRLSGSVSRSMSTGLISSTLTFSLYNDVLNFRSNGNFIATQPANYSSSVNGSLNFDLSEGSYYFTNSMGGGGRGKGNASVTFYQDINNNGKREEDEPIMKGVKISTPGKFTRVVQKEKTILLQDLVPGDRYAVKVIAESFANPYIRPQISEFSFYPEPNTITKIDIPCFSTGILEGRLTKNENGEVVGQGGLKVHILSEDSTFTSAVEVFSDGSFYTMGVPIGKYTMFVDTVQLKLLKSVSIPSTLNFEVKPTIDGDYISQLEFLIIPKSKLQQDLLAGTQESIGAFKAASEYEAQNQQKAGLTLPDIADSANVDKEAEIPKSAIVPPVPTENVAVKTDTVKSDSPVNLMSEDSYEQELRNNIIAQNQIVNSFKGSFNTKLVLYYQKPKDTFLSAKMKKDLDKLAKELLKQTNTTVIVEAYNDKSGTLEEDFAITTKRANEVVGYLIQQGLKSNQIMIHSKGSIAAPSGSPSGANAKNLRCVVIKVLGE